MRFIFTACGEQEMAHNVVSAFVGASVDWELHKVLTAGAGLLANL